MRRYQEKFIICPTEQSCDWAKKQTKVCIVFNCSAKIDQCTPLNEALYSGPPLSCTIFDILFRFRLHNPMGITRPSDVHKTSLLGPSVHVLYCTSIGCPFSVHCSRVDRRLIWSSNGRPKVA